MRERSKISPEHFGVACKLEVCTASANIMAHSILLRAAGFLRVAFPGDCMCRKLVITIYGYNIGMGVAYAFQWVIMVWNEFKWSEELEGIQIALQAYFS